jgi:ketosteroid isomerase-like protein
VPTASQTAEWVEGYRRAWETADSKAAAALFHENALYRSDIFEEPHAGRSGIEDYWTNVTAAQSDITVRMGSPVVEGRRVVVEFWTTMLVAGDELTLPGCLLLQFNDDGLCTDLREYWHTLGALREPPPGWGK